MWLAIPFQLYVFMLEVCPNVNVQDGTQAPDDSGNLHFSAGSSSYPRVTPLILVSRPDLSSFIELNAIFLLIPNQY